jgi:hypothetical protein
MKTLHILLLSILYIVFFDTTAKTEQLDFENKFDTITIKNPEKLISYDFGNKYLMAKSDSNLNINK